MMIRIFLANAFSYVPSSGDLRIYQDWYNKIRNKNSPTELRENIRAIKDFIDLTYDKIPKDNLDALEIRMINGQKELTKFYFNNLFNVYNDYHYKLTSAGPNAYNPLELFLDYKERFADAFNKAEKHGHNLEQEYNKAFGSNIYSPLETMDQEFTMDLFTRFDEYICSNIDIANFLNTLSSIIFIIILTCIIRLLYNYKFKKFHKLKKWIKRNTINWKKIPWLKWLKCIFDKNDISVQFAEEL